MNDKTVKKVKLFTYGPKVTMLGAKISIIVVIFRQRYLFMSHRKIHTLN